MTSKKWVLVILISVGLIIVLLGALSFFTLSAPSTWPESKRIIFVKNSSLGDKIRELEEKGYIRNALVFRFIIGGWIDDGGYDMEGPMNAFELAQKLRGDPDLIWITLSEGARKEQMANILGDALGWSAAIRKEWITKHTAPNPNEIEGVYFPSTYLISVDETPAQVAERLRRTFNEKFEPLAKEAARQNVRWPTVVKMASLIQREAAGKHDMALIAGVMWNRLLDDMRLDIDASVQYVRDDIIHYGSARTSAVQPTTYTEEGTWWTPIDPSDKNIVSPFNSYRSKGLPPHAIANPGLDALTAVLYPEETECFYYLHAKDRNIYCAETFEGHKENIERYLRR